MGDPNILNRPESFPSTFLRINRARLAGVVVVVVVVAARGARVGAGRWGDGQEIGVAENGEAARRGGKLEGGALLFLSDPRAGHATT
jgi:hypothetical protein